MTLLVLSLLTCSYVCAQTINNFSGLKRTQLSYLVNRIEVFFLSEKNDELLFNSDPDQEFDDQLEVTRQNLVNLPAISRAEYNVIYSENDTLVNWLINESRTVSPLFNFGGIKGNFTYLLGFNDIHFRGLGQALTAFYQNNDGEHNYSVALTNSAYHGGRWGYRLESRRYAAIEPVFFTEAAVDYRYSNLSLGIGGSFTPKPRRTFTLGVDLFQERYQRIIGEGVPEIGPADLTQRKVTLKAGHWFDRVNYYNEILEGFRWQTNAQLVHSFSDQTNFKLLLNDLFYFQRVGLRGNLAARFRAGVSSNEDSPFAPFVVDSQVNIRGSGNRIDRGTAQLVLNLEYRHTVFQDRRERYAVQLVAFSDLGNWRNPGGNLGELVTKENLRHFVGGGIRLISNQAQNAVLRLDYGLDALNTQERGFVLGFGQYF
jgi:outer membrane protein assembly factor BamA